MRKGWAAFAGAAFVGGQVAAARFRKAPWFEGHDPSHTAGDPGHRHLRVLVLGDSATTGQGLRDVADSWPRLVASHLADRFHVHLTSLAAGGARSVDVLLDQVPAAELERWDLVILSVGSNDMMHLVPPWRFARHLDAAVGRLVAVADHVVLFGVGDLGTIPRLPFPLNRLVSGAGHIADFVHRQVAERHGVAKVDQWSLTTEAFRSGDHMFSDDLFHPSPDGHRAWADAVIETIEPIVAPLARPAG